MGMHNKYLHDILASIETKSIFNSYTQFSIALTVTSIVGRFSLPLDLELFCVRLNSHDLTCWNPLIAFD